MNFSISVLAMSVSLAATSAAFASDETPSPDVATAVGVTVAEQTNAEVAQIISKTGSMARVNRGNGLVEASTGTGLAPGDSVFTGTGSTVTLHYPSTGCEYTVPSEKYFAVSAVSPCAANADASNTIQISATANDQVTDEDDDRKVALLVGGTVLIGGGILAVVALTGDDDDNDNPATPN